MFGLFKSKKKKQEDKQKSLEKELQEFTDNYKKYFNCYAFTGEDIVIYEEPVIKNNNIVMNYITRETPKGYVNNLPVWLLILKYGGDDFLKQHRHNYIKLKDQMESLGLSVTKIKKN
jgi:hypothetical protein